MKLQARFLQLPVRFDAELLAKEIAAFGESAWMPHPAGYEGNSFIPLIAAEGNPGNESFYGPMLPTPFLSAQQRPYLSQTLASLGAVLGRTRLMRLSGHAEVTEHVDVNYYWRDRMRVHVPIVTQPTVSFHCGGSVVHMAAGECWVFDTWSHHKVLNDQTEARVHLVVDTVGGEGLMRLMSTGRVADKNAPAPPGWTTRLVAPSQASAPFECERVSLPKTMSPWEMREHFHFLLGEVAPNQPVVREMARLGSMFLHKWRALWSTWGESDAGAPKFRALLDQFSADLIALGGERVALVNEIGFMEAFDGLIMSAAVADRPMRPTLVEPAAV